MYNCTTFLSHALFVSTRVYQVYSLLYQVYSIPSVLYSQYPVLSTPSLFPIIASVIWLPTT